MIICNKCGREISTEDMRVCPECGNMTCADCAKDNICSRCVCDLSYIQ